MSGNTFGNLFKLTTFGESHGEALGAIIDGCPPKLKLNEADIQKYLDLRKPGASNYTSPRKEADKVKILSGTFNGLTTGTPIGLIIYNTNQKSQDYDNLKDVFRPSHADYTYYIKYGIRDHRGGGRSSARETTMRVAAGAIARKYLKEKFNLNIYCFLSKIGDINCCNNIDYSKIYQNPFFCADTNSQTIKKIANLIESLKCDSDSIGAELKLVINNMIPGLGQPVFNKLDANLASAIMSINAIKAISIGEDGFNLANMKGSKSRDALTKSGFSNNHAGGILGGISTGQDIIIKAAIKPTSSIAHNIDTLNIKGEPTKVSVTGRHDPCVGIRAAPIIEAMSALVIMDQYLLNTAQNQNIKIKNLIKNE